MITLHNLNKQYPSDWRVNCIAKDISIKIPDNQFVVIYGESGSGKSTILNMIGGLLRPDSGRIVVDSKDIQSLAENDLADYRNHDCGFIFQNYNLISHLTVADNIIFSLMLKRWDKKKARERAEDVLHSLGIFAKRNDKPNKMSGGEQQRVAIGRAVAHRPKIILADEPTGNLDAQNAEEVLKLLKDLQIRERTTVLVASHSEKVKKYATSTYALLGGSLVKK
jgi:putative ABC transport system ATP-binding protein